MSRRSIRLRIESLEDRLAPAAGALDPTFGTGGIQNSPAGPIYRLATVPDGRFLTLQGSGSVARFGPDGAVDVVFGGGVVAIPGFSSTGGAAIAALPDGGAVVAWEVPATSPSTSPSFDFVHVTAAGVIDPTFGSGGKSVVAAGVPGEAAQLTAITVQSDGRLLVAGSRLQSLTNAGPTTVSSQQIVVVRLTGSGQTDPSFGTGGTAIVEFPAGSMGGTSAGGIVVQSDGRVVVAGLAYPNGSTNGTVNGPVAARLTSAGQLDATFGSGGRVVVAFPSQIRGGFDTVSVLPDGRLVLAGLLTETSGTVGGAARLNADGRLDPTYGSGGVAVTAVIDSGRFVNTSLSAAVDASGRTVFDVRQDNPHANFVYRLNGAGVPDVGFGSNGKVVLNSLPGPAPDMTPGLAVLPNGSILLGGTDNAAAPAGLLVRLLGSNPPAGFVPTTSTGTFLAGGTPDGKVQVLTPTRGTYAVAGTMTVYDGFPSSVRATTADVTGDGTPDYITGAGPGGRPQITVFDGRTGNVVADFLAFEPSFTGGVFVAAADLNGDGKAEIVVAPDQGGGPRVVVFSIATGGAATMRASFFGIDDANFRGGARVAVGDVNRDGTPDVLVAAGFLGGPRVALFDGKTILGGIPTRLVNDFFAFPGTDAIALRNGAFAAIGDLNGDGFADLIFGGGPGGAPRVFILNGQTVSGGDVSGAQASPIANFFVGGNATNRGGIRVAATNADGDAKADLVVGSGEGNLANVRVYLGKNFTSSVEPTAFQDLGVFGGATLSGGVYVG